VTEKRPISQVAKVVEKRLQTALIELGGLEDNHLKFLTYFVKHEFKIPLFRFEMNYRSKPKTLTIHCFTDSGQEMYVKAKQVDIFDKMVKHLGLENWTFRFAEKK
jgi:hypothetical protein